MLACIVGIAGGTLAFGLTELLLVFGVPPDLAALAGLLAPICMIRAGAALVDRLAAPPDGAGDW